MFELKPLSDKCPTTKSPIRKFYKLKIFSVLLPHPVIIHCLPLRFPSRKSKLLIFLQSLKCQVIIVLVFETPHA